MKFSCDRCGKRYATADTPVPGRVYKLKCRACGHVIVLKGPAAGADGTPAGAPPRRAAVPPAAPPPRPAPTPAPTATAVEIPSPPAPEDESAPPPAVDAVEPVPPAPPAPPAEPPLPQAFDESGARPVPAASAPDPRAEPEPSDAGYVDLFEEGSLGDGTGLPLARGPRSGPPPSGDEGTGELPAVEAEPAVPPAPPLPTPRVPDLPRPPTEQRGAPLKLIGIGVLVMLGIVAVAVWRGAGRTGAARPPGPASAPAAKAPEAAPAPLPPAPVTPEPAPGGAAPPAPGTEAPAAAPAPERAAPAPGPAAEPARPSRAQATPPAAADDAGEASAGLTPERIQQVIATSRPRFDACLAQARPARGLALDGRTVNLRVAITPAGAATYPTFDDVTIGSTELGACLKSAARQMAFPRFEGEPVRIEVPITLPKR
ncbi:conserved hypothetical protein [Anaeromyxobacter sp. K]|uniref:zinc-ribbon domain-containing protein n=1 Tax=Anaeromyxobacter sp. (strain K) TaxID=447217 RepID=UPI00017BE39D|nr:zinc-ribbon domain-containing protein [Anaeromyxobacter sp. K]ACG74341.1 conserved hypothetical protein [Anaeromyxobacter sp. K]